VFIKFELYFCFASILKKREQRPFAVSIVRLLQDTKLNAMCIPSATNMRG
jgi:hypothetical protein